MDFLYNAQNHQAKPSDYTPLQALEKGQVLFFPDQSFAVNEQEKACLLDLILDGKHKNISFNPKNGRIGGIHHTLKDTADETSLKSIMNRFTTYATNLVTTHMPYYQHALITGRSSYRPAEVEGRASSKRKDDTRLHVDAFPATPVNGLRIMRVFCNVNFTGQPRIWQVGEALPKVIDRFYQTIPNYRYLKAKCLHWVKATKTLRSRYDHCMLHIHDNMKLDDEYQQNVDKHTVEFPAQSSWIVYTDQVSHAALAGQQLFEQTFYLPVDAMADSSTAPISILTNHWRNY